MDVENEFPYPYISDDLGEILAAEELCPGAYYVSARSEISMLPEEYYIVDAQSEIISAQAKTYGEPLPHHPELLSYLLGISGSGSLVLLYETQLYRVQHRLPLPEDESLLATAVYGREENPEYFGDFPAPDQTPFGAVIRSRQIIPGVFALATESGAKAVSVCYPIWDGDLTTCTIKLGQQTEYDLAQGIHNTFGNLFFTEETGCLALFELSLTHEIDAEVVDLTAVKNAVFQFFPEYAIHHNRREVAGLNDSMGMLLQLAGAEVAPSGREENLVTWTPTVGTDYLAV